MALKPIARIYYTRPSLNYTEQSHDVYAEDKLAALAFDYERRYLHVKVVRDERVNLECLAEGLRSYAPEIVAAPDSSVGDCLIITFWEVEDRPSRIEVRVRESGERPFRIRLLRRKSSGWHGAQVASAATIQGAVEMVDAVHSEELDRLHALDTLLPCETQSGQ